MKKLFCLSIYLLLSIAAFSQDEFLTEVNKLFDEYETEIEVLKEEVVLYKNQYEYFQNVNTENEKKVEQVLARLYETNELLTVKKQELAQFKIAFVNATNENKALQKKLKSSESDKNQLEEIIGNLNKKIAALESIIQENKNQEDQINDDLNKQGKGHITVKAKQQSQTKTKPLTKEDFDYKFTKYHFKKRDKYFGLGLGVGDNYSIIGLRIQGRFGKKTGIGFHLEGGTLPPESIMVGGGLKIYINKGLNIGFSYHNAIVQLDNSPNNFKYYTSALLGMESFFGKHFGLDIGAGGSYFEYNDSETEIRAAIDVGLLYKF